MKGFKKRPKQDIVVEVDVKKLVGFIALLVMTFLFVFSLFLVACQFLTVQKFSVSGISIYEESELVSAAGVRRGDRLYSLNCKELEDKILAACPHLSSVKVERKFPNRLHIEVEGKVPQWYIEIAGAYYSLDGDLRIMEQTYETEGLTKLKLPNLKSVIVGEVPTFGESETEIKKTVELLSILRETSFKSRLTLVDLSDRTDIVLEVDGKYRVLMGNASDFADKLREVEQILEQESVKNAEAGEINATVPGQMGFRPTKPAEKDETKNG